MQIRIMPAALVAAVSLALAGCYEQPGVELHEPGAYHGPDDPLLSKSASAQHDEILANRFRMVQTDR